MRDRWDLGSIKKFYPINQKFFITPLNLILSKADSYLNTKKGILDDYANKYTEIVKRVDVIVSSFYPSYIKFNDLKNWKDDSNKISYNIEEFKLSNHEGTLITKVNTFLALDVVGYTRLCSTINSTKTVTLLNHLFSKLDSKCIQYNTWKVCTIGDAMYLMGDIGLEPCPKKRALNICKIALGVMDELQICPNKNVELRIGIASGCIISRLFGLPHMYRVYGRTIQRAVYMESSSEINKIQIDENTLRLIDGYLSTFQHHDKIWLN
ncbi:hypothetical protein A3Q56_02341 [Intoshia linei]|uniref:Guanylate cyclase domain-containing protein n=1 Tax=Intoshia linei TaxID=1819745 RepID=A0A177B6T9_9BILA|nr:hypothetical protein A3Q56_02341 [Intoshia linei]